MPTIQEKSSLALFGGSKTRQDPFPYYPSIGEEEKQGVLEVLESGMLSGFIARAGANFLGGKKVKQLEAEVGQYYGMKHAIAVNSATAGLHAAFAAIGIGPGDEVIVPPFTMSATASAVLMCQGVPVFADIEEDTYGLDPVQVEKAITPKTKAIAVVHLLGHPARIVEIMKVATKHNLKVIEDCAQAPGATLQNRLVGTFGDMSILSFNQHKVITTGEGGVILTNDDHYALKAQLVRNHGESIVGEMAVEDISNTLGWNYRLTELEAAVGIPQFRKLDKLNAQRIDLAGYLTEKLSKYEGLTLPTVMPECKHVYFLYPIKFNAERIGVSRNRFVEALSAEGIPAGCGYIRPLYLEPLYQKGICFGKDGWPFHGPNEKGRTYPKGLCPVAERLYEKDLIVTSLCRYPLTPKDMDDVARGFSKLFDHIDELK